MSQNQNSIPINSKSLWPATPSLECFLPSWYDIGGRIEFQDSEDLVNTSLSSSQLSLDTLWLSLDTLSHFIENHSDPATLKDGNAWWTDMYNQWKPCTHQGTSLRIGWERGQERLTYYLTWWFSCSIMSFLCIGAEKMVWNNWTI